MRRTLAAIAAHKDKMAAKRAFRAAGVMATKDMKASYGAANVPGSIRRAKARLAAAQHTMMEGP